MRPICKNTNCSNPAKKNGLNKSGFVKHQKICSQCAKKQHSQGTWKKSKGDTINSSIRQKRKKYGGYKKLTYCEKCGFVAEHSCQLDVDHIDGNHQNNKQINLQTLCSNCHRLKTWKNRDNIK